MIKYLGKLGSNSLITKVFNRFSSGAFAQGDLKKAEQYVIQTLRQRSWVDYMIGSYFPKNIRNSYYVIQLFNLQLIKISDNIRQPSLGIGKLQFWRNTINKIYQSQKPNAQPISICLNHACHTNPLTKGYFERIINVRADQLSSRNIESMDHMLNLCQNNFSTLIALNLQLLRIEIEKQHQQLLTKMGHCVRMEISRLGFAFI